MIEKEPGYEINENYSEGWLELEKRQKSLVFMPIVSSMATAISILTFSWLGIQSLWMSQIFAFLLGMMIMLVACLRLYLFRCPRCQHHFFKYGYLANGKHCFHCGIQNGSRLNWWK